MRKMMLTAVVGAAGCLGSMASAQNLLQNPGFEGACSGPAANWVQFGPGNGSSRSFFGQNGTATAIKMFGAWCGDPCYGQGLYQVVPVTAGQRYSASALITNPCWDRFIPGAQGGIVHVEYYDAGGNLINVWDPATGGPQAPFVSNRIDAPTLAPGAACGTAFEEVQAALVEVPFHEAPAGAVSARVYLRMQQFQFGGGAGWWDEARFVNESDPSTNLLANASFESPIVGCGGSGAQFWTNFGNGQHNLGQNTRTGDFAAMLFGGFNGDPAFSGWWQQVPAVEGERFQFSGWGNTLATDLIRDGNNVRIGLEFFDEFGFNLIGFTGPSAAVPTGAANTLQYEFYQSEVAEAPAGTAFARALILQVQSGFAGGATWWDDMELVKVVDPTCPCPIDYNNSGSNIPDIDDLLAFFDDFNNGSSTADINCTGEGSIPDVDDLVLFFDVFNNGCP